MLEVEPMGWTTWTPRTRFYETLETCSFSRWPRSEPRYLRQFEVFENDREFVDSNGDACQRKTATDGQKVLVSSTLLDYLLERGTIPIPTVIAYIGKLLKISLPLESLKRATWIRWIENLIGTRVTRTVWGAFKVRRVPENYIYCPLCGHCRRMALMLDKDLEKKR